MKGFLKFLDKYGIGAPHIPMVLFALYVLIMLIVQPQFILAALFVVVQFSFIWAPILFVWLFAKLWMRYVRSNYLSKQENIVLEIKLPDRVEQSPQAMELFLNTLHITSNESTFIAKYLNGSVRPDWSLELISDGGIVRFFIRARKMYKDILINRFNAFYPDADIQEVEDYAYQITYNSEEFTLFGMEFALTKDDAYPIKTYIDYDLERKDRDDQGDIADPLTHALDFLGSVQEGQRIWLQIMIKGLKGDHLKDDAKKVIKEILGKEKPDQDRVDRGHMTVSEERLINAIQRSVAKPAFEVGMRALYIPPANGFNVANLQGMIMMFKPFGDENLNGFKPAGRWHIRYDFPWQNFLGKFKEWDREKVFTFYRGRDYFYHPYKQKHFVLTTEELATIFHLPYGQVRIPHRTHAGPKKGVAPTNLPT